MNKIVKSFFEGLIVLVPMVVTVYVFYLTFVKIDGLLNLPIPGLGFLVTIVLVTLVGMLASNLVTKRLFDALEGAFTRVPLAKLIYSSIRDLVGSFVGDKKTFDRPVLVSLDPAGGVKAIGFVTKDSLEFLGLSDDVAVYLPQSYNFAGNLLVLPKDRVMPLEAHGSEVMAFLVSGGVARSEKNQINHAQ
ncbi:MAG TPA: DUF502 domain-containing protein [Candidatus Acidoferrales bacterium]|nr:DUF502 domain-containing protein [Candidatus Acidoferrales bacterium]